jgi:hypothetical protein
MRILTHTEELYSGQLIEALKSFLGDNIKEQCYCDEPIKIARLIRNAIAHNNHKKMDKLDPYEAKLRDKGMIEGEEIMILAWHTTELYHLLKERALLFAQAMVKLPSIK